MIPFEGSESARGPGTARVRAEGAITGGAAANAWSLARCPPTAPRGTSEWRRGARAVAAQLVRDLIRRDREAPGRPRAPRYWAPIGRVANATSFRTKRTIPPFPFWGRVSGGAHRALLHSASAFRNRRTERFTRAPLQRSIESSRAKVLLCSARHRVRLEWLALLQGNTRAHSHRTPLPRHPRGSGLQTR